MSHHDIARARAYVGSLDLPLQGPRFEAVDEAEGAVEFTAAPQAVVIGAQLAEFTPRVSADTRSAVADSLLIAQLAANKAASSAGDVFAWYGKYVEVLQNLGWLVTEMEFKEQQVADRNAGLHTAIIPVVTAMLAPGAALLPMVLSALNGLHEMDASSKWITTFDRASQHAHGAKFQLSHVDADADGNLTIAVMCFGIDTQRTVTQVLFFKFAEESAGLKSANGSLSMTLQQLAAARTEIAARVRPFVADFVKSLDI